MRKLYANNHAKPIRISERDMQKIGRGYDIGHSFGMIKDLDTRQVYVVKQASCGSEHCNCAVTIEKAGEAK